MEPMLITKGFGPYQRSTYVTMGFGSLEPQAVTTYTPDPSLLTDYPDLQTSLDAGFYNKNLLMLLGDFWAERYAEYETLKTLSTGVVTLLSSEYRSMLELVLSSNIADIPAVRSSSFGLVAFKNSDATYDETYGTINRISFPLAAGTAGPEFLANTLFSPSVVLKRDVHYTVSDGHIHFFVDIFEDEGITRQAYYASDAVDKYILFWAVDIALTEYRIYERFGKFLYQRAFDSASYKAIVKALQDFFTGTKTVGNIRKVFNALFGLPLSAYDGETVTAIDEIQVGEDSFHRITTDYSGYLASSYSELRVDIGDVLNKGTLLADMHAIDDYITRPDWYENTVFPWELVEEYTPIGAVPGEVTELRAIKDDLSPDQDYLYQLIDRVLKYNLIKASLKLTYSSYDSYVSVRDAYGTISTGLPDYLYVVYEVLFLVDFIDDVETPESEEALNIILSGWQDFFPFVAYDPITGEPTSPDLVIKYDGSIKYDGTYKYIGYPMPNLFDAINYESELQLSDDASFLRSTNVYDGSFQYDGTETYDGGAVGVESLEFAAYNDVGDPIEDPYTVIPIEWGSGFKITLPGSAVQTTRAAYPLYVELSTDCGSNGFDATEFFNSISYLERFRIIAVTQTGVQCSVRIDLTEWSTESKTARFTIEIPFVTAGIGVIAYIFFDDGSFDNRHYVQDAESLGDSSLWVNPQYTVIDAKTTAEIVEDVPVVIEAKVIPYAYAQYSYEVDEAQLIVQFSDRSVGTLTNWLWDFGDGNTSTEQNPTHTYEDAGQDYNVTLRAKNRLGQALLYSAWTSQISITGELLLRLSAGSVDWSDTATEVDISVYLSDPTSASITPDFGVPVTELEVVADNVQDLNEESLLLSWNSVDYTIDLTVESSTVLPGGALDDLTVTVAYGTGDNLGKMVVSLTTG